MQGATALKLHRHSAKQTPAPTCSQLGRTGRQKAPLTCISHSIHANDDVGHVVQGVKDAEDVHAVLHCQITEPAKITKFIISKSVQLVRSPQLP